MINVFFTTVTEELVRKKSEHNECVIGTLEELSLHQEDVEKIEYLHNWCKGLQILYLQSNLISKIENLNKLKQLEYLNLAINNIEKIENLERCESLQKLDLTLNFIGELESVRNLIPNIHLRQLYLTGNPCTEYEGYRDYVIAILEQIETLDNVSITRSERIKAKQKLRESEKTIRRAQKEYEKFREEQKARLSIVDDTIDDESFWKSTSEHAPETRLEISRRSRLARGKDKKEEVGETKAISVFNRDGRPLNMNQAKVQFKFDDSDSESYTLDISVYKFLDTSYIDVDLQPIFVKITIKGKIFQYVFPEEIITNKSKVQRSQTTGHLLLTMPKLNYKSNIIKSKALPKPRLEKNR
ncbi:PREDICTED: protein tilB [Nicrophorus vespilloides]|uniref:Protein tilB n=1 Tax=Nicrophorus vespilloides TaxID=110193 RepID=A0ABM1N0J0_NICVS|nr:PREDICTED: protein tilB [Nicrophorus vespilloides]